ncbi:hypothetical protein MLD38_011345 [Melastoma candidum]|uniref:Uncharacterized protein n=1 Tax=Melastoma candidum TaxID=119954 RepID=A0ACB9R5S7_9MYRT|nr:hypothetical protein MLD38_011345 [Melastoma candidum]
MTALPKELVGYPFYMRILQHCILRRLSRTALAVQAHMTASGHALNQHLSTKLVLFYSSVEDLASARKVFDGMCCRSVVSWTAMISGYCHGGCWEDALLMFEDMHRAGIRANQFTYASTLRASTGMRSLRDGLQLQGCIEKGRFTGDLYVQSALVDFHSKCGKMDDAVQVFESMSGRDAVAWNGIIGGFAGQGLFTDSVQRFRLMMREGSAPDHFTFGCVLRACAGIGNVIQVTSIHKVMVQLGYESATDLIGSLINAYAKCGSVNLSGQLYECMPMKDVKSCTALVNGYAQHSMYGGDFLSIVNELLRLHIEMDCVLWCSMLHVCADGASLSLGRQLHARVLKLPACKDVAVGNALVDMYSKAGEISDADHAFGEIELKNVISWTSLISAYGRHGLGHEAIALYRKMGQEGFKPNEITFLCTLFACSHSGLTHEGWECFKNMVINYGISPRPEHFSCLVDISARGGKLDEAYELLSDMDIKPSASLWRSIAGACYTHGNISLGKTAASNLIIIDPENCTNYVLLSSIYAIAGAWDSAWKIRSLAEKMDSEKDPGCSLLLSP